MHSRMNHRSVLAAVIALSAGAAAAPATPIPVGTGANSAQVEVQFKDLARYEFAVAFDGDQTGLGLLDIIEAGTTLTTVRRDFGFGIFIDGIAFDGHDNSGYGGGEDWWHYWTKESGDSSWTAPLFGATDRVVTHGDSDGWVYGSALPPGDVPEPATALLLSLAGLLARARRAAPPSSRVQEPTNRRPTATPL